MPACQFAPFIPWIRKWLIFGSFIPTCVLLGNSVLFLHPLSPSQNSGHYPEFPFIHPSWLLFPWTLNPACLFGFLTMFFPLILIALQVANFWIFWPFSQPRVRAFFFPWATVTSLGLSRVQKRQTSSGPQGEITATCDPRPHLYSPRSSSRPGGSTVFPMFLSSPQKRFPTVF